MTKNRKLENLLKRRRDILADLEATERAIDRESNLRYDRLPPGIAFRFDDDPEYKIKVKVPGGYASLVFSDAKSPTSGFSLGFVRTEDMFTQNPGVILTNSSGKVLPKDKQRVP